MAQGILKQKVTANSDFIYIWRILEEFGQVFKIVLDRAISAKEEIDADFAFTLF